MKLQNPKPLKDKCEICGWLYNVTLYPVSGLKKSEPKVLLCKNCAFLDRKHYFWDTFLRVRRSRQFANHAKRPVSNQVRRPHILLPAENVISHPIEETTSAEMRGNEARE